MFTRENGARIPETERMETEDMRTINITEW
jgi:hypothetical protein